jgi:glycerol-3-phosphate acyltransferase PlsY
MAWFLVVISLIGSYLLGSVNAAVIVSRIVAHDDIRNHGSGNAGMTNIMRTLGFLPGVVTLLIDTFKGVAVCFLAKLVIFPYVFEQLSLDILRPEFAIYYCGILCLLGHVFPVFFEFRGGKGVATTMGIAIVCQWQTALIAIAIFVVLMLIFRIVSLGSIMGAATLPFFNIAFAKRIPETEHEVLIQCILFGIISFIIIFMHRSNIVRLIRGEEKKFTIKKNKEPNK